MTSRQKAIKSKQKRASTTTRIRKNKPSNALGLKTRSKLNADRASGQQSTT